MNGKARELISIQYSLKKNNIVITLDYIVVCLIVKENVSRMLLHLKYAIDSSFRNNIDATFHKNFSNQFT